MSIVFGRQYELTVWSPEHTYDITPIPEYVEPTIPQVLGAPFDFSPPTQTLSVPAGTRKLVFTDHQFTADVEYTLENKGTSPQNTTIKIYNIDEDKKFFIRKDGYVTLKAGYVQPYVSRQQGLEGRPNTTKRTFLPLIFVGQITKVYTQNVGQDVVTTILCSDSKIISDEIKISRQYPPQTTYKEIVLDLMNEASKNGLSFGHLLERPVVNQESGFTPSTFTQEELANSTGVIRQPVRIQPKIDLILNNGYVANGSLISVLDEVCQALGYRHFISLGRLYVEPKDVKERTSLIKVTKDHIKGGAEFESDNSGKTTTSTSNQDGVTLNLFLNGEVSLDKKVQLEHSLLGGYYDITSVKHKLDFESTDTWTTVIEGRRVVVNAVAAAS